MNKLNTTISFRANKEDVSDFFKICEHNNLDKSFVIRNLIKNYTKKEIKKCKKLNK